MCATSGPAYILRNIQTSLCICVLCIMGSRTSHLKAPKWCSSPLWIQPTHPPMNLKYKSYVDYRLMIIPCKGWIRKNNKEKFTYFLFRWNFSKNFLSAVDWIIDVGLVNKECWLCLYVYVCVFRWEGMCACVCGYVWRPEVNLRCHSSEAS